MMYNIFLVRINDMKNNRLFGIIHMLLLKDTITASELAEYFEVSVRTIYRDIELLSSMNIPIYMTPGKHGGIHLLDSYKLDKTLLTEEEQNQILFALESLEKLSHPTPSKQSVTEKMKTMFQKEAKEWITIDFNVWGSPNHQHILFDRVKQAILEERKITFTYYNSYGKHSNRKVEPLQIHFKYNAWYLFAFDETQHDYRLFKLNRIKKLSILEETFERELPKKVEKKELSFKTVTLVLEIDSSVTYRVYDEFDEKDITVLKNGNFLVQVEYPETDWIYGYILSFGEFVKVKSPTYVKEELKQKLKKMNQLYL